MTIRKHLITSLKLGVLLFFLVLAVKTQDFHKIKSSLENIKYHYIGIYLVLYALSVALYSVNYYLLLRAFKYRVSVLKLLYYDLLALAGTYYTPGGLGGMGIMIYMLRKEGVSVKDSTIIVFVDKIITAAVAATLACFAFRALVPIELIIKYLYVCLILVALGTISLFGLVRLPWIKNKIHMFWDFSKEHKKAYKLLLLNIFFTLLILSVSTLQHIVAFYVVGVPLDNWALILAFYGVILIVNYLPISIGGIGVAEFIAVFMWGTIGVESEQVLAAFFISRTLVFLCTLILTGSTMFSWIKTRNKNPLPKEIPL